VKCKRCDKKIENGLFRETGLFICLDCFFADIKRIAEKFP